MTIMEVYKWVIGEAQYHREEGQKLAKDKEFDASNRQEGLAQAFYQVAAKLEETQEVNPKK